MIRPQHPPKMLRRKGSTERNALIISPGQPGEPWPTRIDDPSAEPPPGPVAQGVQALI